MGRYRKNPTLWIGFLAGNLFMIALNSTFLWNPLSVHQEESSYASSQVFNVPNRDCQGLEGTKVLLLDVHFEGNLGDELETTPLLQELRRCGIHTTAVLSGWLEGPQKQLGVSSIREHGLVDSLERPDNYERFNLDDYHAVILAPGPWKLCELRKRWPRRIDVFVGGSILVDERASSREDCTVNQASLSSLFEVFNPSLVVVRESYSYNLVQGLPRARSFLSGDLSHSFKQEVAPFEYWKTIYSSSAYRDKILIFARSSNVANTVAMKGRSVQLNTLDQGTVLMLPVNEECFIFQCRTCNKQNILAWQQYRSLV